jgi:hypothetical protein
MVVGAGQQVFFTLSNPFCSLMPLALGAMAVAAAIITNVHSTAIITGIYMATQGCCSALRNGPKRFLLMNGKSIIACIYMAQHTGYFAFWLHWANTLSSGLWGN